MADGSIHFDTKIDESGLKNGLSKLTGSVSSSFNKIGSAVKVGLTAATASIGAASAAVGALTKDIVSCYAEYEQLVGGVQTLFGAGGLSIEAYAESVGKSVREVEWEYDKLIQAQQMVFEDADNAWKDAGLSANDYMSTATSFSASLIKSLNGDTQKAAQATKMAIIDMSDNANKMGTDMTLIQNAYQGFAKGNYSMLDNLKLGYGGTATEMARLINDSGVLGDKMIDLGDKQNIGAALAEVGFYKMLKAIHVVQEEMGITGTTAAEAASTITGSANAMKAAWANMMVGMADDSQNFDALLANLLESIETFAGNIIPRIEMALQGIAKLVDGVAPIIIARLPGLASTLLPQLLQAAGSIVGALAAAMPGLMQAVAQAVVSTLPQLTSVAAQMITSMSKSIASGAPMMGSSGKTVVSALLTTIGSSASQLGAAGLKLLENIAQGVAKGMPGLVSQASKIITTIGSAVSKALPTVLQAGASIVSTLAQGIVKMIPSVAQVAVQILSALTKTVTTNSGSFLTTALNLVEGFADQLIKNVPKVLAAGLDLMKALVKGVADGLPTLIERVPVIISKFASVINQNAPTILKAGVEMLVTLGKGIINAIPTLVKNIPKIAKAIFDAWQAINWLNLGKKVIDGLVNGIKSLAGKVVEAVKGLGNKLTDTFMYLPNKFLDIGKNIISGLWNGIKNSFGSLGEKVTGLFSGLVSKIKSSLGIHSPSKVFKDVIGKNIGLGAIQGITATKPQLEKAMDDLFTPKGASGYISKLRSGVAGTASHTAETARTTALASPRYPSADEIAAAIWDNAPPMGIDLDGERVGELIEPRVSERQAQKTEMMNRRDGRVAV